MAEIEIPKTHKACVYDKPGECSIKVVELETPEPGPGEVLINMTHSGVCHSDYGIMMNSWPSLPYPTQPGQVGGHEGVGKIVKIGPETKTMLKVGDRAGVKWVASICRSCPACLAGHEGCCLTGKVSGYYTPGTFQQYVLGPADYVTPIPEGLDAAQAAPILCAGLTVYNGLLKSKARSGEWVVVMGAGGGLGHIACQLSSRGLGHRVIGIDSPSKEYLTLSSGASHFLPHTHPDLPGAVYALTGGLGAHAVLVCTSAQPAYDVSLALLRFGGTCCVLGLPEGPPAPIGSASPGLMVARALSVVGIAVGSQREAVECLEFAARGVVKAEVRTVGVGQLEAVFREMEEGKVDGRVVVELERD